MPHEAHTTYRVTNWVYDVSPKRHNNYLPQPSKKSFYDNFHRLLLKKMEKQLRYATRKRSVCFLQEFGKKISLFAYSAVVHTPDVFLLQSCDVR